MFHMICIIPIGVKKLTIDAGDFSSQTAIDAFRIG